MLAPQSLNFASLFLYSSVFFASSSYSVHKVLMFTKVPFSPLFPLHNFSLIKISSFASYVVMTSYLSSLEDHTPVQNPLECKCFFWNFLKMNYKLISCFHLTYSSFSLFLIPVDGMTSSCWSYKLRNDHGFFIFLLSSHLGNRLSHVGSIHFLSPLLSFLLTYWQCLAMSEKLQ